MYLIKNAKILTMAQKDYENGDILINDGKIQKIARITSYNVCYTKLLRQINEIYSFHNTAFMHIETGDYSFCQHSFITSFKSITPSYSARPVIAPANPAAFAAIISSVQETPPDNMTSIPPISDIFFV